MEVGQQNVEAQFVVVEIADVQHVERLCLVSVYEQGCARRGMWGVEVVCVEACTVMPGDERIAQQGVVGNAVEPGSQERPAVGEMAEDALGVNVVRGIVQCYMLQIESPRDVNH